MRSCNKQLGPVWFDVQNLQCTCGCARTPLSLSVPLAVSRPDSVSVSLSSLSDSLARPISSDPETLRPHRGMSKTGVRPCHSTFLTAEDPGRTEGMPVGLPVELAFWTAVRPLRARFTMNSLRITNILRAIFLIRQCGRILAQNQSDLGFDACIRIYSVPVFLTWQRART